MLDISDMCARKAKNKWDFNEYRAPNNDALFYKIKHGVKWSTKETGRYLDLLMMEKKLIPGPADYEKNVPQTTRRYQYLMNQKQK